MTTINLGNKSTRIEQIWVEVNCSNCGRNVNVRMKSPSFNKNCSCGNSTFSFRVDSVKASAVKIRAQIQVGYEASVPTPILSWEIEEE